MASRLCPVARVVTLGQPTPGEDALLTQGPLCMILLTCVRTDEQRSLALAASPALLAELLEARAALQQPADADEDADQWLRLLMAHLCFDSRRLGPVFEALCRPGGFSSDGPLLTVSHGAMFHLLADAVDLAAVQGQQHDDGVEQARACGVQIGWTVSL